MNPAPNWIVALVPSVIVVVALAWFFLNANPPEGAGEMTPEMYQNVGS